MMAGKGGPKNAAEGFGWLLRAARGGNVAAQNDVSKHYMEGIGVEPDTKAAASWYMLARRAGLVDPIMEDFLDGLTDDEIKEALERANRLR
jgi:TPR repeat protein